MTILAQDNFDADTVGVTPTGWKNIAGTWLVSTARPSSGLRSFTSGNDGDRVLYTGVAARADGEIQSDFVVFPSGSAATAVGHVLRHDINGAEGYEVRPLFTSASTFNIQVLKRSGATEIATGDATNPLPGLVAGDIVHMASRIIGTTLSVWVWKNNDARPTTAQSVSNDSTFSAAGYFGLRNCFLNGTAASPADNFVLTDGGAAGAAPGVPTIGLATAGAGQATINFTPADSTATSFTATWSNGGTVSGASSPLTLTGLTPGVAGTFHVTATNLSGTSAPSAESNSVTPTAVPSQLAAVQFSPYNWNIGSSNATTVNPGAWFRVFFSGNTCTLNFATASADTILYRIDRGPLVLATVATSIVCDMTNADGAGVGHLLEVWFRSFDTAITNRWGPTPQAALTLTNIVAGTLTAPDVLPARNVLVMGDSITEGISNVGAAYGQNAMLSWGSLMADLLGANVGVVGFASQGWTAAGQFGVPIFGSSWNFIYSGVARTFAPAPDLIIILQGQNDGGANLTSTATPVLTAMLAATPSSTKIIVLSPLSQNSAASLQAAVTGINNSRLKYISTAGFKTSAQVHPYFNENISRIAPSIANAVFPMLTSTSTGPTLTSRTVSGTLAIGKDSVGNNIPAANMTLSVSFWDESTSNTLTTARYQSASLVTNSAGVWSFVAQSTLASGGTGYVAIRGSGVNYTAPVVVA